MCALKKTTDTMARVYFQFKPTIKLAVGLVFSQLLWAIFHTVNRIIISMLHVTETSRAWAFSHQRVNRRLSVNLLSMSVNIHSRLSPPKKREKEEPCDFAWRLINQFSRVYKFSCNSSLSTTGCRPNSLTASQTIAEYRNPSSAMKSASVFLTN